MARRRSLMSDTSSLELLLDTICNTFGGIVFVSLLVVILVNMSSRETADTPPEPVTQAEMLKKQTELESLRQDLKELQTTLNQQS